MRMTKLLSMLLALVMLLAVLPATAENPSTWLTDELTTITVMRGENALQPLKADTIKLQTIKELLNIELVVEAPPSANYNDTKTARINSNDMPDIMLVSTSDVRSFARKGMFVNLSEYRDELPHLFALLDADPSLSMLTVDGDFYSAPSLQRLNKFVRRSGNLFNFRTDLLAKYDLEAPKTFDDLYDAMLVIKQNEPEMVGLTCRSGTRKFMDRVSYPLGSGSSIYYDADKGGVWLYGPAHEEFKGVLEYLNKLYEADLLDHDYATNTKDQWAQKLSNGTAMGTIDNDGVVRNYVAPLQQIDPSYNIEVLPVPENALGEKRIELASADWTDQQWVIATSSKKIELCLKFLDWCYSEEGAIVNGYGKEGVTFYFDENGDAIVMPELLEEYSANPANAAYDIQIALGVGLNDVSPYVDTGVQMQMEIYLKGDAEAQAAYLDMVSKIGPMEGNREPVLAPPLSEAQTERYTELLLKVENLVWQEVDKYIKGEEPIENWDNVIATIKADAEEMEEIYNEAWNAALGK
ncbi:MAG: extracellular solute-binding protein [Clostridiales bacterium]|nr:extracellular solute-binding protein [Clostridiales bacterium]